MLSKKFIFCASATLAILVVILLATISHIPHQKPLPSSPSKPWLALFLYIQQPQTGTPTAMPQDAAAFVFHRALTEGPKNTSRVVGKAQGFIIPVQQFARSGFNIIYLTFNTHDYSGSVSIQAKNLADDGKDELTVVGGTGSFAFVRGTAVLTQTDEKDPNLIVPYHIKLHLKYPDLSQMVPG